EGGHLLGPAQVVGQRAGVVVLVLRLVERLCAAAGAVLQGQETARRQGAEQLRDHGVGVAVGQVAHDPDQHQRDRLGQVQRAGGGGQYVRGLVQVTLKELGDARGGAGQVAAPV